MASWGIQNKFPTPQRGLNSLLCGLASLFPPPHLVSSFPLTPVSILAWKIPWTEGPGRLQSMGSQEPDTTEQLRFFPDVQPRLEPFKGYVAV